MYYYYCLELLRHATVLWTYVSASSTKGPDMLNTANRRSISYTRGKRRQELGNDHFFIAYCV